MSWSSSSSSSDCPHVQSSNQRRAVGCTEQNQRLLVAVPRDSHENDRNLTFYTCAVAFLVVLVVCMVMFGVRRETVSQDLDDASGAVAASAIVPTPAASRGSLQVDSRGRDLRRPGTAVTKSRRPTHAGSTNRDRLTVTARTWRDSISSDDRPTPKHTEPSASAGASPQGSTTERTATNTETKDADTPSSTIKPALTTRFASTIAKPEIQLSHEFVPSSTALKYGVRLDSLPRRSEAMSATMASEENRSSAMLTTDHPGPSATEDTLPNGEMRAFDDVLTELFPVEPAYDAPSDPFWLNNGNESQQYAVPGITKGGDLGAGPY